MISEGLVDEVKSLLSGGYLETGTTAAQAIGYKEIISYINGECSLACATDEIKLSSRRYAKRQLTWFRHVKDAERIFVDTEDGELKKLPELTLELHRAARELLERI